MQGGVRWALAVVLSVGSTLSGPASAAEHFTIKDDSIVVPSCVRGLLAKIAADFHGATGQGLVVTDGTRSVERQAQMLFHKLSDGENIVRLYAAKALAREVTVAYRKIPADERERRGEAVIQKVLEQQVAAGKYISKHLRKGALDLRTRDFSKEQLAALKAAIKAHGVQLVDETRTKRPHYHLNFLACLK